MTPIAKTFAPDVVEARPTKPVGEARRISSLGGQPTIHADPAAGRKLVHVKPAWQAPSARIKITKQSLVQGAAVGSDFPEVIDELGKQIRPNILDRLMSLQTIEKPTEAEKDEYTKLCCTIIKNSGVSDSQMRMVVRAAFHYMKPNADRS